MSRIHFRQSNLRWQNMTNTMKRGEHKCIGSFSFFCKKNKQEPDTNNMNLIAVKGLAVIVLLTVIFIGCGKTQTPEYHAVSGPSEKAEKNASNENSKAALAGNTQQRGDRIAIADGRKEDNDPNVTSADKEFVSKIFKQNEAAILKQSKLECDDDAAEGVEVIGAVKGAFTKPETRETAYLYERCRAGRNFGIGGLIIASGDVVAVHYVFGESGLYSGISSPGDINANDISEIVLTAVGSGQGYSEGMITLLEFADGELKAIGQAGIYSSNGGAAPTEADVLSTAYNINVEKGATPVFYRETYEMKGSAKKWSRAKKSEKFTLDEAALNDLKRIGN